MSNEQAKSELMQIYGSLSEEKKQALDVLMAQADGEHDGCEDCVYQANPQDAMPCRECKQNYMDMWKARPLAEPYKGMTNGQVHDMLYQMLVELKDGEDRYGAEKWWNSPYEPQERSE